MEKKEEKKKIEKKEIKKVKLYTPRKGYFYKEVKK